MEEKQVHKDAFERYFLLLHSGNNKSRAIEKLSKEIGVSTVTIYKWKKEFNWDTRELFRSKEVNKKVEERTNETVIDNKVGYLSLLHNVLNKYVTDVAEKKRPPLEINTINDAVRLIRTALEVQGETSEDKPLEVEVKGEIEVENNVSDEYLRKFGDFLIEQQRTKQSKEVSGQEQQSE